MRSHNAIPCLLACVMTLASLPGVAHDESVETFTRDISLSPGDKVRSVESISGGIILQQGSRVIGNVETERGDVLLEPGVEVGGRLQNDAGTIAIDAARVMRGIATTDGDICIGPNSLVKGGILVRKRARAGLALGPITLGVPIGRSTPPVIVIASGATVEGRLRFKREVELYVGEGATIGTIEGATPIYFSDVESAPSHTHLCTKQPRLTT